MEVDPKDPVDPTEKPVADPVEDKTTVKYETHKKLLDEKKKVQADKESLELKLKKLEDEKLEAEKADLVKKGDLQKLLELEREEKKKLQKSLSDINGELANGSKLRSVLEKINGKVDEQYWGLIDLDKVIIDQKTGMADETSVQSVAADSEKRFAKVISVGDGVDLPNDAPRKPKGSLTIEEWQNLPLADMKKRLKEVVTTNSKKS